MFFKRTISKLPLKTVSLRFQNGQTISVAPQFFGSLRDDGGSQSPKKSLFLWDWHLGVPYAPCMEYLQYLHLLWNWAKCRYIFYRWSIWVTFPLKQAGLAHIKTPLQALPKQWDLWHETPPRWDGGAMLQRTQKLVGWKTRRDTRPGGVKEILSFILIMLSQFWYLRNLVNLVSWSSSCHWGVEESFIVFLRICCQF